MRRRASRSITSIVTTKGSMMRSLLAAGQVGASVQAICVPWEDGSLSLIAGHSWEGVVHTWHACHTTSSPKRLVSWILCAGFQENSGFLIPLILDHRSFRWLSYLRKGVEAPMPS